jgi:hypothetical protein
MRQVTLEKERLVETLTVNREKHEADFEIVWEAFRKQAMSNAKKIVDSLKEAPMGAVINLNVGLQPPVNHSDDYTRAIEMCKWEVEDHVQLDEQEFAQYVQDEWGWKQQFEGSNFLYTGMASPSSGR